MNLEKLLADASAAGIKIYGEKLWETKEIYGTDIFSFKGTDACIETPNGTIYARATKGATVPADGKCEIYSAVALRDYAGEYEGTAFDIRKGDIRLFWR